MRLIVRFVRSVALALAIGLALAAPAAPDPPSLDQPAGAPAVE